MTSHAVLQSRSAIVLTVVLVVLVVSGAALLAGAVSGEETTADRALTTDVVGPGGTVQVTVEASVASAQNLTLTETVEPAEASIEVVDDGGASDVSVDNATGELVANYTERSSVSLTYRVTVDENVSVGTVFAINGTLDGDGSHELDTDEVEVVDDAGVAVWFDDPPADAVAGAEQNLTIALENLDPDANETTVTLTADGSAVNETTVALDAHERSAVTLGWTPDEAGEAVLEASTATHNTTHELTVLEPASFDVSGLDAPAEVYQFESFDASVVVENTGEAADTQTVTLETAAGTTLATASVSLDGGEETTVTFDDVSVDEPGVHTLVVTTDDDETDRPIAVEATPLERELSWDAVGPGGAVEVTVTADLEAAQDLTLTETFDPAVASIEVVDDGGADAVDVAGDDASLEATFTDTDTIAFTYRIDVAGGADVGDSVTLEGWVDGDETIPVGPTTVDVVADPGVGVADLSLPDELVIDEEGTITATMENLGPEPTVTNVTFSVDGAPLTNTSVSLDGHERTTVDLAWTPGSDDLGDVTMTVATDTHEETADATVYEPASFVVFGLDAPSSVVQFGSFDASVVVENTGGVAGSTDVTLSLDDGTVLETTSVDLDPGERTTVTFEGHAIDEPGVHLLVAESDEDTSDRPIVVEATTATRSISSSSAAPGGTIEVTVRASVDGEQTLTLEETIEGPISNLHVVDDDGADSYSVDPDAGTIEATFSDRASVAFTYRVTLDDGMAIGDVVELDGSVHGEEVTLPTGIDEVSAVDDPGVAVLEVTADGDVVAGEPASIDVVVENLGPDEETVTLLVTADGELVVEETVTVGGFERAEHTVTWTPTAGDIGEVDLDADTGTHNGSTTVDVLTPASFGVNELDAPALVTQFDAFDVTVTVENVGEVSATQTVTLSLDDGTVLGSVNISLDAGQSTTVTFADVAIERSGTHDLEVATADDVIGWQLVAEQAAAGVTLPDQLIGTDSMGEPALYVEDVMADAGWTIVLVDADDPDRPVLATTEVTEQTAGSTVIVSVPTGVDPGTVEAVLVANGSSLTVGEPFADGQEVLASDEGLTAVGELTTSTLRYDDETDVVHVSAASLDVGEHEDRPFVIGLYRVTSTGSLERIATSQRLFGSVEHVAVELDEPLTDAGSHPIIAKIEAPTGGPESIPYERADGATVAPMTEHVDLEIVETPTFVVENVTVDDPVTAGESVSVTVTVANEGAVAGTATVWVEVDNRLEMRDVSLAPGENATVTVSVPIGSTAIGDRDVHVDVGDDTDQLTVTVEPADDGRDDPSSVPGFGVLLAVTAIAVAGLFAWLRRPQR